MKQNQTPKTDINAARSLLPDLLSRPYSDWFGTGDRKEDVLKILKKHGEPVEVLFETGGYMACILYADKVFVVGYDGNEYRHSFEFPRAQAANKDAVGIGTGENTL